MSAQKLGSNRYNDNLNEGKWPDNRKICGERRKENGEKMGLNFNELGSKQHPTSTIWEINRDGGIQAVQDPESPFRPNSKYKSQYQINSKAITQKAATGPWIHVEGKNQGEDG